jgi:putative ABC transport system permease protein
MSMLLTIALRNLVQARRRTLLLGSAIGLVTALLVLLSAMSAGIKDNLIKEATIMSAGHVVVAGFFKTTPSQASPIITDKAHIGEIIRANVPELDYMVERGRGFGKMISETSSTQVGLTGIVVEDEGRFLDRLRLAKESEYKEGGRDEILGDAHELAQPNTMVLFVSQAKRLGVGVGDVVTVQTETNGGRTNTADAKIVAVAEDLGLISSFAVFVPMSLTKELYGLNDDTTGAWWIYLKDIDDADAVMGHLREVFAKEGFELIDHEAVPFFFKFEAIISEDWTGQKLDVTTWDDEVSFLIWVITAFDTVTLSLIGVLVVIIVVGIMNTMWNVVRERTREIGTMRAIGMSRGRVLALFLLEALLLGLGSTLAGSLIGVLAAVGIDALKVPVPIPAMKVILFSSSLHFTVLPGSIGFAVVFLTLFTALSALWPAIRASGVSPITALSRAD